MPLPLIVLCVVLGVTAVAGAAACLIDRGVTRQTPPSDAKGTNRP